MLIADLGQGRGPDTLLRVDGEGIEALGGGRDTVFAAFAGITDAELHRQPAAGEWSPWAIAFHLVDLERWYLAKLCEAATPNPVAALERYLGIWARLRDEAVALAGQIPEAALDRPGLLSGVPRWTPRGLLAAMAAHDHEHAEQIRAARKGAPMPPAAPIILHITTAEAWGEALAAGWYRGDTLDSEGFIHCSTPAQALRVANLLFRGQADLVLLAIDPRRLSAPLRYEGAEDGERFPHIHGPLEASAVTRVFAFEPGDDGRFSLPAELSG